MFFNSDMSQWSHLGRTKQNTTKIQNYYVAALCAQTIPEKMHLKSSWNYKLTKTFCHQINICVRSTFLLDQPLLHLCTQTDFPIKWWFLSSIVSLFCFFSKKITNSLKYVCQVNIFVIWPTFTSFMCTNWFYDKMTISFFICFTVLCFFFVSSLQICHTLWFSISFLFSFDVFLLLCYVNHLPCDKNVCIKNHINSNLPVHTNLKRW